MHLLRSLIASKFFVLVLKTDPYKLCEAYTYTTANSIFFYFKFQLFVAGI